MLIAAAYASQRQGWRTPSSVFVLAPDCSKFEPHHTLATVGAHDVETISVGNNHFAFFSSDLEGDSGEKSVVDEAPALLLNQTNHETTSKHSRNV